MKSRSIYNFNTQQKQAVLTSKSSSAIIERYSTPVICVANKTVLSRVRSGGGRYSTSRKSEQLLGDSKNNPSNDPSNNPSNDSNSVISPSKNNGYAQGSGSIYCPDILHQRINT